MGFDVSFLYGIAFGVFKNDNRSLTILLGIIGIDIYW